MSLTGQHVQYKGTCLLTKCQPSFLASQHTAIAWVHHLICRLWLPKWGNGTQGCPIHCHPTALPLWVGGNCTWFITIVFFVVTEPFHRSHCCRCWCAINVSSKLIQRLWGSSAWPCDEVSELISWSMLVLIQCATLTSEEELWGSSAWLCDEESKLICWSMVVLIQYIPCENGYPNSYVLIPTC